MNEPRHSGIADVPRVIVTALLDEMEDIVAKIETLAALLPALAQSTGMIEPIGLHPLADIAGDVSERLSTLHAELHRMHVSAPAETPEQADLDRMRARLERVEAAADALRAAREAATTTATTGGAA